MHFGAFFKSFLKMGQKQKLFNILGSMTLPKELKSKSKQFSFSTIFLRIIARRRIWENFQNELCSKLHVKHF
jgi:hypothetical protein